MGRKPEQQAEIKQAIHRNPPVSFANDNRSHLQLQEVSGMMPFKSGGY
jgi:hypothetical protein